MSPTIWDKLADTPWWIYPLYYYFLRTGYLATKSRLVPLKTLRNFTIIFVLCTFALMLGSRQLTIAKFGLWIVALASGVLVGWLQFWLQRIKSNPQDASIRFPGNWLILCVVMTLLILQLYKGYGYYFHLYQQIAPLVLTWLPVIYGAMGGMFIGKFMYSQRCVKLGPHVIVNH